MEKYRGVIVDEDLPVLVSAIECRADCLVTGDKKHFGKIRNRKDIPLKICSPSEFVETLCPWRRENVSISPVSKCIGFWLRGRAAEAMVGCPGSGRSGRFQDSMGSFMRIAFAFDEDGFGVVQEAVEDGGGEGAVVVEDFGPVFEARFG